MVRACMLRRVSTRVYLRPITVWVEASKGREMDRQGPAVLHHHIWVQNSKCEFGLPGPYGEMFVKAEG